MPKKKILVIGIDSGTWDIFNPLMEQGCMPHLAKLTKSGSSGILHSTCPPLTPPAWTTLMTGVHPGRHRILGFQEYDCHTDRISYTTSQSIKVETMWSYLSRLDYQVVSLNMPVTFPPYPVNGVMVSSYGSPGNQSDFTWPPELKEEILRRITDFSATQKWQGGKDFTDEATFDQAVASSIKCFNNEIKLFDIADSKVDWDILMIQSHQLDRFLHFGWGAVNPKYWSKYPKRARKIFEMFVQFDRLIGHMISRIDPLRDMVAVVSDHGHGPLTARVKPNILLHQWDYLQTKQRWDHFRFRLKKNLRKLRGLDKKRRLPSKLSEKTNIDMAKTKAYVVQADQIGSLFINVRGRQPEGIVSPGAEYNRLIDSLINKFSNVKDPAMDQPVFDRVARPQEIYGINDDQAELFGDLLLIPAASYWLRVKLHGQQAITPAKNDLMGTHDKKGMYLCRGTDIKNNFTHDTDIANIVPTFYAFLEAPIPRDLDGKVIHEIFDRRPRVTAGAPLEQNRENKDQYAFNQQEEEIITQKLTDMGYL